MPTGVLMRVRSKAALSLVTLVACVAGFVLAATPARAQDSVVVPGQVAASDCPVGYQYSTGIMVNTSTQEVFTVCNSPLNDADLLLRQQDQDFYEAVRVAQAAAEQESRAWNADHPGQQKCVQWGPITHANGVSTSSGGVCANPVSVPTVPTVEARPESSTTEDARVEQAPPAPAPQDDSQPAPAPGPSGIGGWAMVDDSNQNRGTTVCDVSVCGDPNSDFSLAYKRDHPEIRFVYFAPAEPGGNVAGWSSGSYDPSTNLFWYNGCSHRGGSPVGEVSCPPAPAPASGSYVEASSDFRSQTVETHGSEIGSQVVTVEPPNSSQEIVVAQDGGISNAPPVTSSSDIRSEIPAVSTSARLDAPVEAVTSDSRDGSVTSESTETKVAIASLIKSAVALPAQTTASAVKLAVSAVKITSKSLTPKICTVTSKGVKQRGYGKCKLELSVTLADGSKVSTSRVINFKKRS
mgnify:FL=1